MVQKYAIGQTVYVPSQILPDGERFPTSLYKSKIVEVRDRSAKIDLPRNETSDWIATSKIHDKAGILVITIGDFSTEDTLLNPLAKSILQFSRLLLDDSSVTAIKVRSIGELGQWWESNNDAYSHIVLIGHGAPNAIHFGFGGSQTADEFQKQVFKEENPTKKTFISLCCETGKNAFARKFSNIPICKSLIAPYHSIHGAVASQFFETFMCWHLIYGKSTKIAFKKSADTVPGSDIFRLWQAGEHQKSATKKQPATEVSDQQDPAP